MILARSGTRRGFAVIAVALGLLVAACSAASEPSREAASTGPEAPTVAPEAPEPVALVCGGQMSEPAAAAPTAAPAPLPPPPSVAGSDESAGSDAEAGPIPTPTPTPQPALPSPGPALLAGAMPANGPLPEPDELEIGSFVLRIDQVDYLGNGVVFGGVRPFIRLEVGDDDKTMSFNLPFDGDGIQDVAVGSEQPATIYGGDAVDTEFVVAPGPAANTLRIETDSVGTRSLGTFDLNVCELTAPVGHRMTGSFHVPTNDS